MLDKDVMDRGAVAVYPPVIFECKLEGLLKKKMGAGYSITAAAAFLDVAPLTMRRILDGCGVSLENALRLSEMLGRRVGDIWTIKKNP